MSQTGDRNLLKDDIPLDKLVSEDTNDDEKRIEITCSDTESIDLDANDNPSQGKSDFIESGNTNDDEKRIEIICSDTESIDLDANDNPSQEKSDSALISVGKSKSSTMTDGIDMIPAKRMKTQDVMFVDEIKVGTNDVLSALKKIKVRNLSLKPPEKFRLINPMAGKEVVDPRNAFEKAVEANPVELNRNVLNEMIKKGQCELLDWTIMFISDRGLWNLLFNREKNKVLTMLFLENYIDKPVTVTTIECLSTFSAHGLKLSQKYKIDCFSEAEDYNIFTVFAKKLINTLEKASLPANGNISSQYVENSVSIIQKLSDLGFDLTEKLPFFSNRDWGFIEPNMLNFFILYRRHLTDLDYIPKERHFKLKVQSLNQALPNSIPTQVPALPLANPDNSADNYASITQSYSSQQIQLSQTSHSSSSQVCLYRQSGRKRNSIKKHCSKFFPTLYKRLIDKLNDLIVTCMDTEVKGFLSLNNTLLCELIEMPLSKPISCQAKLDMVKELVIRWNNEKEQLDEQPNPEECCSDRSSVSTDLNSNDSDDSIFQLPSVPHSNKQSPETILLFKTRLAGFFRAANIDRLSRGDLMEKINSSIENEFWRYEKKDFDRHLEHLADKDSVHLQTDSDIVVWLE